MTEKPAEHNQLPQQPSLFRELVDQIEVPLEKIERYSLLSYRGDYEREGLSADAYAELGLRQKKAEDIAVEVITNSTNPQELVENTRDIYEWMYDTKKLANDSHLEFRQNRIAKALLSTWLKQQRDIYLQDPDSFDNNIATMAQELADAMVIPGIEQTKGNNKSPGHVNALFLTNFASYLKDYMFKTFPERNDEPKFITDDNTDLPKGDDSLHFAANHLILSMLSNGIIAPSTYYYAIADDPNYEGDMHSANIHPSTLEAFYILLTESDYPQAYLSNNKPTTILNNSGMRVYSLIKEVSEHSPVAKNYLTLLDNIRATEQTSVLPFPTYAKLANLILERNKEDPLFTEVKQLDPRLIESFPTAVFTICRRLAIDERIPTDLRDLLIQWADVIEIVTNAAVQKKLSQEQTETTIGDLIVRFTNSREASAALKQKIREEQSRNPNVTLGHIKRELAKQRNGLRGFKPFNSGNKQRRETPGFGMMS